MKDKKNKGLKTGILLFLALLISALALTVFVVTMYFVGNSTHVHLIQAAMLAIVILLLSAVMVLKMKLLNPLNYLMMALKSVGSNQKINQEIIKKTWLEDMGKDLAKVSDNMMEATKFAVEIGEGEFDRVIEKIDEGDALNMALLNMRDKLKEVADQEKKRNWAIEGVAKFSEILRQSQDDIEELSYNVISSLVKYLSANQGGVFLFHNDGTRAEDGMPNGTVELISCYAFERRKFLKNTFDVNEGLVGQCIIEANTIYISDVPDSYVKITSGLGNANPRAILICPLKVNDEIYGAIELASFKVFQEHEIAFVEELCESIASTLASAKMGMSTKKLLVEAEKANKEMMEKEEQMKDIQSELNVKLQEIDIESKKSHSIAEAINKTNASIEFDMNGKIIGVNELFLGVMGYTKADLIGKYEEVLLPEAEKNNPQHEMMWDSIKKGQYFSGEFKRKGKQGKDIWMNGTYNPISDIHNVPYKVVKFASFVTEAKEMEMDLNGKLSALKNSVGVIEMNPDLTFASVNQLLLDVMGYKRLEIRRATIEMFIGKEQFDTADFAEMAKELLAGKFQQKLYRFYKKDKPNEELYYQCTLSPINNLSAQVVKIMVIMIDVTQSVINERKMKEELKVALENSNMIKLSDTTKDTKGMLNDLDTALHEMNQGALDVESMLKADKIPMLIFNPQTLTIENTNAKFATLFLKTPQDLKALNFFALFDVKSEDQRVFNFGMNELNVFNLNLNTTADFGSAPVGGIFTPLLGKSMDDTKYCLILSQI